MDGKKVTVLTPNGRRQNMTITPSTTILQILEGVCAKHEFNPDEYDLKHHNTVLDPSIMFRFSGLPNNCFLEMVETTRKRETGKEVVLCIQLEDGSRRQGTFPPSENLLHILRNLCPDNLGPEYNPVLIYMRKEIFGDDLNTTTLKSLGITGRAMIRLINKNPEELRTQANVSVPIAKDPPSNSEEVTETKKCTEKVEKPSTSTEISRNHEENAKEKVKPSTFQLTADALKALKNDKNELPEKRENDDSLCTDISNATVPSKKIEYDWGTGGRSINDNQKPSDDTSSESEPEEILGESEIIELGQRNAVIFSLAQAQKVADDLPDSFFELTTEDLRVILKDLRKQASESEEPLLTSKLRELQEQSRILTKMNKYNKSVIRVQFPDRFVLQGTFKTTETMQDVYKFINEYLADPSLEYHLFTTPPKKIPDMEKTLIELDFVPAVVLHFGVNNPSKEENFLKTEILTKLSSPNGATLAASKSRGRISKPTDLKQKTDESPKGAVPKKPKPDSFKESKSSAGPSGQVPKWFRAIKK